VALNCIQAEVGVDAAAGVFAGEFVVFLFLITRQQLARLEPGTGVNQSTAAALDNAPELPVDVRGRRKMTQIVRVVTLRGVEFDADIRSPAEIAGNRFQNRV
jgi:hypothetical protein